MQPCGTSMGRLHHASTTARHAAARAMFMENRRCKCTWSLRRSIFDLHVASLRPISWRQALAGSTLRSSARGRRGPPSGRAERSPRYVLARDRSGAASTARSARQASRLSARERRASRGRRGQSRRRARASSTAGAAVSRCLARLRPRRAAIRAWLRWSSQEAQQRHQRVATQSRNAQHPARDTWLPRQTPPT